MRTVGCTHESNSIGKRPHSRQRHRAVVGSAATLEDFIAADKRRSFSGRPGPPAGTRRRCDGRRGTHSVCDPLG